MTRQETTGNRQQEEGTREEARGKCRKATGNRQEGEGKRQQARGKRAYVLLETVIATGLLIVGLAVIGAQLQESDTSVRKMDRKMRAMMLGDAYLAQLDLGLVPLDSVERELDGDFGPRFPDWGWTMLTEQTAIDGMFGLSLAVWHHQREEAYTLNSFDFEHAEVVHTLHALRAAPRPLNLGIDFGLNEDEMAEFAEKASRTGVPGLDPEALDRGVLPNLSVDELIKVLPLIADALGVDISYLTSLVPPDVLQSLQEGGLLDESGALPGEGEGTEVPSGGGARP